MVRHTLVAARYRICPKCKHRYERIKRLCPACGAKRPKPRVAAHARTLRDDPYPVYVQAARDIHNVHDESCCVCGKPRTLERKMDRDHGHLRGSLTYGKPRGLACGGNQGCNVLMVKWVTAETAQGIADAKRTAGEPDAERWQLIADYLARTDEWYRKQTP